MWESINSIALSWWSWQWALIWQTALLVAIVAIADLLIRRWAWPQLRYALLCVTPGHTIRSDFVIPKY